LVGTVAEVPWGGAGLSAEREGRARILG